MHENVQVELCYSSAQVQGNQLIHNFTTDVSFSVLKVRLKNTVIFSEADETWLSHVSTTFVLSDFVFTF